MKCKYDPMELKGEPIGMLHCPECGEMVLAGCPHPDHDVIMDASFDEYCESMDKLQEQYEEEYLQSLEEGEE